MSIDKQKLKAAALAIDEGNALEGPDAEDAMIAFEDVATPSVILALLAEIEQLQRIHMRYSDSACRIGEALGIPEDDQSCFSVEESVAGMINERDQLKSENEALRKDAERYRFVSKLAWYVDRAAQVYDLCNVNSNWQTERGSPDEDEVEEAVDAAMAKEAK